MTFKTLEWTDGALHLLDQRRLPADVEKVVCSTPDEVAAAIRNLTVRGAPAIGVAAAYGMVLAAPKKSPRSKSGEQAGPQDSGLLRRVLRTRDGEQQSAPTQSPLRAAADTLKSTRPTAINLAWAVDRMLRVAEDTAESEQNLHTRLEREAIAIHEEDAAMCRKIGENGAGFFADGMNVLTHCNAGALATAGIGTALAVIYTAHAQGKHLHIYADETRPVLQGARLTMWELMQQGIPATLITDNTAAAVLAAGKIDAVIVGADRIAQNGDVANKIGTYNVAILAAHHGVPFYVAAPRSTFDDSAATGADIPIEERSPTEVTEIGEARLAPEGAPVFSPAFDVTPNALITAIISDTGVHPGGRGRNLDGECSRPATRVP